MHGTKCQVKLHNKEKHTDVATCLNISTSTIRYWLSKYNNCFKNYIRITDKIINNYKTDHPHKSIKRLKFTKQITEYVEANEGCSLDDISKKATNSMISKPTICRVRRV